MKAINYPQPCHKTATGVFGNIKRLALVVFLWSLALPVLAAPEEIQVYLDDLRAPRQLGVDIHINFVASGRSTSDYPGERPPAKVLRATPEFAYGLSPTTELGLYLLTARGADGHVYGDGVKARIKYIAPHDTEAGPFWGSNFEIGRSSKRVSESAWNAEIKGILGFRTGPWTLAINPNIDWSLSQSGGPATAQVDLKVNYTFESKTQVGVESYNELGPLRNVSTSGPNSRILFAVVDTDFGAFDLNAGLGRGISQAADKWIFKFILGTNF